MPDLAGNIEEIQNSLKASLGRGRNTLDQNVVAASKRVLLHTIEFKSASAPLSLQCSALKAKYTPLNPSSTPSKQTGWNGAGDQQRKVEAGKSARKAGMDGSEDSLPHPKVVLFPEEHVKMDWPMSTPSRIGAGLVNMGNTCFFNSTLQCLTYTAPLVNYCRTTDHRAKCKKKDFCMMCEIQTHIRTSLECGGRSIKPHSMLQKLRCIAKHMRWGRQEDAHEFLRFVIDHLQQSCLNGEAKIDKLSKETTVINQIFGGYLRSQVTCLCCQGKSNTFDPFMDLSLDIKGVNTVEDALSKFVKPETLDNENAYKCPKCRNKVRAHKRFSIQKAPNILTLQLNRFDLSRHLSGKINRYIRYPERINLRQYMSQRQGEPVMYHLYGVLVHSGHSSDCGHYYSYVKSPSKTWYCMNDSIVHQANQHSVFSADAYVLFYARVNRSSSTPTTPNNMTSSVQSKFPNTPSKKAFIGPVLPNHVKHDNKSILTNGLHGKTSSDLGASISRQQKSPSMSSFSNAPKIIPHTSSLPDAHKKISFPILTTQQKKLQQQQDEDDELDDKKRIVLQIKHGNSTTMEKSPDGKSNFVNGTISTLPWSQTKKNGLVPYNDDSDSEQENKSVSSSLSSSSKVVTKKTSSETHLVQATGDNIPSKSRADVISQPIVNGGGDSKLSSLKSQQSKTPFVWGDSPSPTKPVSAPKPSDGQSPTPSPRVVNNIFKDRQKLVPSPSSSSASFSKNHCDRSNLAIDLPAASLSRVKTASSGTWYVHPQDGVPSPRGSSSSSNSINSTSEWMVVSKQGNGFQCKDNGKLAVNGSRVKTSATPALHGPSTRDPSANGTKSLQHTHNNKESRNSHSHPQQSLFDVSSTPVNISDKQSLLSPSSSHSSESSSKKSDKLKDKQKQTCRSREGSSTPPSDSSSRKSLKKKKKKSKKHKKEKEREEKRRLVPDSDSDSDAGASSRKKLKTREEKRSKNSVSLDSSSSGEDGYEWVERTVQSPAAAKAKVNQAFVQSWNHHVKDDLFKKGEEEESKPKKSKTWDGVRQPKLDKVLKGNNLDYKAQVLSWTGGKSQLTKDLESDREMNKKRQWSDRYDEELDAGKVKKVKAHREETGYGFSYNPFQDYHHFSKKGSKDASESSWSQDHSYYHRHDQQQQQQNNNGYHYKESGFNGQSWHVKSHHKYNNSGSKVGGGPRKFFRS